MTTDNNLPAVRQSQRIAVPLAQPLTDMDQAWRAAGILARAGLLPEALYANNPERTQANVTLILWYGAELGLPPMQALQSIYIVNGRPSMAGQLWLSKVREAGHIPFVACKHCDVSPEQHTDRSVNGHRYEADHDSTRCTFTIIRGDTGARHTETFTIEEAETAKLTGKKVWQAWPKRMLQWRAITNCATTICPEVALGYSDADLPGEGEAPLEDALASVVDARTEPEPKPDEPAGVVDAEVVEDAEDQAAADEAARAEVLRMQAEHQAEPEPARPAADYSCICGAVGDHYEDECPNTSAARP